MDVLKNRQCPDFIVTVCPSTSLSLFQDQHIYLQLLYYINMELYATGFNAWRQLEFDNPSNPIEEPDDIAEFRSVLKDQSIIGRPCASLSYTLGKSGIPPTQIIDVVMCLLPLIIIVNTSTKSHCAGFSDELSTASSIQAKLLGSSAAIAGNGKVAGKYSLLSSTLLYIRSSSS